MHTGKIGFQISKKQIKINKMWKRKKKLQHLTQQHGSLPPQQPPSCCTLWWGLRWLGALVLLLLLMKAKMTSHASLHVRSKFEWKTWKRNLFFKCSHYNQLCLILLSFLYFVSSFHSKSGCGSAYAQHCRVSFSIFLKKKKRLSRHCLQMRSPRSMSSDRNFNTINRASQSQQTSLDKQDKQLEEMDGNQSFK